MQSLQKKNEFIEQMCSNLFRIRQQTFACHACQEDVYDERSQDEGRNATDGGDGAQGGGGQSRQL